MKIRMDEKCVNLYLFGIQQFLLFKYHYQTRSKCMVVCTLYGVRVITPFFSLFFMGDVNNQNCGAY